MPKKGNIPWNKGMKGITFDPNWRKHLAFGRGWNKGKKWPRMKGDKNPTKRLEVRRKISKANKGRKLSEEHKRKLSETRKRLFKEGKLKPPIHNKESRKKSSLSKIGDKNPAWQGGISFKPYGLEFNDDLKLIIRFRDDFTCQSCGMKQNGKALAVHHINYLKGDNSWNNLIALCHNCHSKTMWNRNYWTNHFNQKPIFDVKLS